MELVIAGAFIFIVIFIVLSKMIHIFADSEEILVKNKNERMKDLYRNNIK